MGANQTSKGGSFIKEETKQEQEHNELDESQYSVFDFVNLTTWHGKNLNYIILS